MHVSVWRGEHSVVVPRIYVCRVVGEGSSLRLSPRSLVSPPVSTMRVLLLLVLLSCLALAAPSPLRRASDGSYSTLALAAGSPRPETVRNLFVKKAPCTQHSARPCHEHVEYEFDLIDLGPEYRGGVRFWHLRTGMQWINIIANVDISPRPKLFNFKQVRCQL